MSEETPAYRVPVDAPSIGDGTANVAQPAVEETVTAPTSPTEDLINAIIAARWVRDRNVLSCIGETDEAFVEWSYSAAHEELAAHVGETHNAWLDAQAAPAEPAGLTWEMWVGYQESRVYGAYADDKQVAEVRQYYHHGPFSAFQLGVGNDRIGEYRTLDAAKRAVEQRWAEAQP